MKLRARGHQVGQQREYPVHYRSVFIGKLIPDHIVDGKVITDPKVVSAFNDTHLALCWYWQGAIDEHPPTYKR